MSELRAPTVEWSGRGDPGVPLIVMLHGWGESEAQMLALVSSLPTSLAYVSVRAPYENCRRYGWFMAGRSFDDTARWFDRWVDSVASGKRRVILVGFSAGAAFAGGVLLLRPQRYAGAAILCGTLPFDAGIATPLGRLAGTDVFLAHRSDDGMIPPELLDRAWAYLVNESGARTRAERYPGRHGVSERMLADLAQWLSVVAFPAQPEDI